MRFIFLLRLVTFSMVVGAVEVPSEMFINYFRSLNIRTVRYFLCVSDDIKSNLLREMSKSWFSTSFYMDLEGNPPLQREGGVVDVTCGHGIQIIQNLSRVKLLNSHTEWLLVQPEGETNSALTDMQALPSSYVTLSKVNESFASYYDVYRTTAYHPLRLHHLGDQRVSGSDSIQPRPPRRDFDGALLRTTAVILYPEMFDGFESLSAPELDCITKISYPLAINIKEQLNFSTSMIIVHDYGWAISEDGTRQGMHGLLLREEVDFVSTGMYMTSLRINELDFTAEIFHMKSEIMFKQPGLSAVRNVFLLPFSLSVWLTLVALALATALLLRLDSATQRIGRSPFQTHLSTGDATLIVVGFISQQGCPNRPKCLSAKIVLFIFSLSAIFFFTSYSAKIVGLLQTTSSSIRSLDDFTRSELALKIQDIQYMLPLFEESNDPDVNNLYHKKISPQGPAAWVLPPEGIKFVHDGGAFKGETQWSFKLISDTFDHKEKCSLSTLKVFILPVVNIALVKRSGYREMFTRSMSWQRDVGLITREKKRWLTPFPSCAGGNHRRYYKSLDLISSQPSFLLLAYGITAAGILLLIEWIYFLFEKANIRRSNEKNKLGVRTVKVAL